MAVLSMVLGTALATIVSFRLIARVDQALLLWPVSAVGLAISIPVWRLGWKARCQLLLTALSTFLATCPLVGLPWSVAITIGVLTCVDILIGATVLSRVVQMFDDLRQQMTIFRFMVAITVGPLTTGVISAFPIAGFLYQSWRETAQTNVLAVSLGMAVVTPVVLWIQELGSARLETTRQHALKASAAGTFFIAVSSFVFWQNTSPSLFMVVPPLVVLLLITGLEGAIATSAVLATVGWFATTHGHGPILLTHGAALDHLKILQIFTLVCAAGALPIGALLDERKRAEAEVREALAQKSTLAQQLESSRHLFLSFAEHSPNLTFIKDEEGRYVYYNQQFSALFGVDAAAWLGKSDHDLFPSSFADGFRTNDLQVMKTGKVLEIAEKVAGADGVLRSFKSIKFAYQDVHGQTMLAGVAVDVTKEAAQAEESAAMNRQLELLADTDTLTGLHNRQAFERRAELEFSAARRAKRPLSILVLDIDNFKQRNDIFGHAVGDQALKILAAVLSACARSSDLAARIGGEEFAVLLPDTAGEKVIEAAEVLQAKLRLADHGPVPLTVSVGAATLDEGARGWQDVLAAADDAMYEAKRTGKDRIVHRDECPAHSSLLAMTTTMIQ